MAGKIKIEITLNADGTAAVHSSDRSQPIQVHQSSLGQLLDPAADLGKLLDRFAAAQAQRQQTNAQQAQAQQPPSQQTVAAAVAAAQQVVQGQTGYSTQGQRFTGYQIQQPLASAAASNQSTAATGAFSASQYPQPQQANTQQVQAQPGRTGLQNAAIGVHGFQAGRGIAAAVANPTIGNLANAAAAASTLSSLGAVATAGGVVGAAFGAVAVGAKKVIDAFDDAAKRFGEYAPQASLAQSQADVRQATGDVRRAAMLDERLAEFVNLQSEVSQYLQNITSILLKAGLDTFLPIMQGIWDAIKTASEFTKGYIEFIRPILEGFIKLVDSIPNAVKIGSAPLMGLSLLANLHKAILKYIDSGEEIDAALGIDLLFPDLPGFKMPAGVVPFRSPVDFPRR